jgi:hypothetical protein
MGILHDAFAKVKQVIERWHDHVDPETSLREAQIDFMGHVAKLVHELELRVDAMVAPIAKPMLAAADPPPPAPPVPTEPAAPAPEATTSAPALASEAQGAAEPEAAGDAK